MDQIPFRILSLNGGGVRGIFQAVVLRNLQNQLGKPLHEFFDLVTGTSTGAIIALAASIGIDPSRMVDLYKNRSKKIFNEKFLSLLRKGARYDNKIFKEELVNVFGTSQLRDVKTKVLITSSCLDHFSHRIFSSFHENHSADKELLLVDIAMASAAAPTYFDPIKPEGQERSYLDGGLWANSPSLISVLWANRYLHIPLEKIKLLSVGTGFFPKGALINEFNSHIPISFDTIKSILEIMFATQESSADFHTKELLGKYNYYNINCQLEEPIHIDDPINAVKKLPALAEIAINENAHEIIEFLQKEIEVKISNKNIKDALVSDELIEAAGLTGFYPNRRYYSLRGDASAIDSYINTAQHSVTIVSINLMTGIHFNNLCKVLKDKLEKESSTFTATISLLNPNKAELIFAISPVLSRSKRQLFDSIVDTIEQLKKLKECLSESARKRLKIRVHNSIPFGSAIIIDHEYDYGRIQIETKPYKVVLNDSIAFEVAPFGSSGLFGTLLQAYTKLLEDGSEVDELIFELN